MQCLFIIMKTDFIIYLQSIYVDLKLLLANLKHKNYEVFLF